MPQTAKIIATPFRNNIMEEHKRTCTFTNDQGVQVTKEYYVWDGCNWQSCISEQDEGLKIAPGTIIGTLKHCSASQTFWAPFF